jgi:small nuclear ribonucleoprotein (snRNP)-like protein
VLRDISQHTNIKLRQVSEQIVDWVHDGELSDEVRAALEQALITARTPEDGRRDGA